MRVKVRFLTPDARGGVSRKVQVFDVPGPRIALGRGTDNRIALKDLRVPYRAADIVVRDTDLVIEAIGDTELRIDGVLRQRWLLAPGTTVELGPYRLTLEPPEPDAQLVLTVELTEPPAEAGAALLDPEATRLGGRIVGERRLSWALFLLTLVVALVLPVVAHLRQKPPLVAEGGARPGLATAVASPGALDAFDRWWSSGELSSAHKFLGERCDACHIKAFELVQSEACAGCHRDVRHHFDTAKFRFETVAGSRLWLAGFEPERCTACHGEHQGATSPVPRQQSLCAGCHADLSRTHAGKTELLDAADFGAAHPQFRPSVIVDPASGRAARAALKSPDLPKERSGLDFPHDRHLAAACEIPKNASAELLAALPKEELARKSDACLILRAATRLKAPGRPGADPLESGPPVPLDCADCHRPEPGGLYMRPVTMQTSCAFAGCHDLVFDKGDPARGQPPRFLPHGQPDDVIAVVEDWIRAKALKNEPILAPPENARRIPGRSPAPPAPASRPDPGGRATAEAAKELETIFKGRLCGQCHDIKSPQESPRRRWEVLPVAVQDVWLPKSRFDHGSHANVACTECHAARSSAASTDVLLPGIEVCRRCHQGEAAAAAVPSTCAMCHDYHDRERYRAGETLLPAMLRPAAGPVVGEN